jgi:periplasmic divalent cation tolerance protein
MLQVKNLTNSYIVILVTTIDKQEAEKISQQLLEERLIACANIFAVSSIFHWSGKTETAEECLILMKSRLDLFEKVSERVKALHSYEVPEILALPVVKGSADYISWLSSCLK